MSRESDKLTTSPNFSLTGDHHYHRQCLGRITSREYTFP